MLKISEYRSGDSNMIMADVQILANNLLFEHGLMDQGWMFNFDRAKLRFGLCDHKNKIISMSKYLTPGRTFDENMNTLLHEVAHAIVGAGHGHDAVWKAKAIELGCDGERCSSLAEVENPPEFRWFGVCDYCGYKEGLHRAPNRVRACLQCAPRFDFHKRLSWHEFGVEKSVEEMPDRFQAEFWKLWNFYNRTVDTDSETEDTVESDESYTEDENTE
jgi:hypothetical protein